MSAAPGALLRGPARVAACVLLAGAALSCATPRPVDPHPPHVRIVADVKATLPPCAADAPVEMVRGPMPLGMIEVTRASSTSENKMKARLEDHEAMARRLARRFCADGVSVLQAEEERGFIARTTMVLWRRPMEQTVDHDAMADPRGEQAPAPPTDAGP